MKINKKLVYLKAYYFFQYGAAGSLIPFLMVHLKKLGLTPLEAGFINGITQLCSIVLRPLTGVVADKRNGHKFLLLFTLVLYGCGYFSLMVMPRRKTGLNEFLNQTDINEKANKICEIFMAELHGLEGRVSILEEGNTTNCMNLSNKMNNNSIPMSKLDQDTVSVPYIDMTVILVFITFLIAKTSYSSNQSLLDTVTYSMIESKKHLYSRQRIWGTIGSMVSVIGVIFVVDVYYNCIFYIFAVCGVFTFTVGLVLDVNVKSNSTVRLKKIIKTQVTSVYMLLFLLKLLCFGILLGTTMNFLFWFLKDIGIPEYFLGIIVLINCVSSVIVHQISPILLKRLGPDICMYLGLAAYGLRFLGHSFIYIKWYVIPLELMHGFSYSLLWSAASSKMSSLSPDGSQATFQGLAGAIYNDLGRGLGAIITGNLFQHFNARWVLRSYGIASCFLLVAFKILDKIIKSSKDKEVNGDLEVNEKIFQNEVTTN